MELKTYFGTGCQTHTGSSGFTNHFGNSANPMAVFKDFPEAVIVDGKDDWSAPEHERPGRLVADAGIQPLAWFHSGISGITKSGLVLTAEDYTKFKDYYLRTWGLKLEDDAPLTIYRYDPTTDPRNTTEERL